jgi:hypothetical protein
VRKRPVLLARCFASAAVAFFCVSERTWGIAKT